MKNLAGREVDKVPLGKSWCGGQLPGSGEAAGHHGCKERGFQEILFYKGKKSVSENMAAQITTMGCEFLQVPRRTSMENNLRLSCLNALEQVHLEIRKFIT